MEQNSTDAIAKVVAFANGLRKNIAGTGRRWAQWPGGANDLAKVIGCIDGILQRLQPSQNPEEDAKAVAACIADLRTVLEWTTYQSASLAMARAVGFARKTRTLTERFGLLDGDAAILTRLIDSEDSLIETIRTKNGYMIELAQGHAHLGLPRPLVDVQSLSRKIERKPGKLDLIQKLSKSTKGK